MQRRKGLDSAHDSDLLSQMGVAVSVACLMGVSGGGLQALRKIHRHRLQANPLSYCEPHAPRVLSTRATLDPCVTRDKLRVPFPMTKTRLPMLFQEIQEAKQNGDRQHVLPRVHFL